MNDRPTRTTETGRCPQCGSTLTRCNHLAEGLYYRTHYTRGADRREIRMRLAGVVALTCPTCEYCTDSTKAVAR